MSFCRQFCLDQGVLVGSRAAQFPYMARTGSFSALLCENSGRRAQFPGKLPRSLLKAAIPVERAQVLMASYRSVPCVSPRRDPTVTLVYLRAAEIEMRTIGGSLR